MPVPPPLPDWISKRVATVENFALGRFYTYDVFMLWRMISGQYYPSPVMALSTVGGSLISDSIEVLGTRGINDSVVAFLDDMTIYYYLLIERDLKPLYINDELWRGWERFTEMMTADYVNRPKPFLLPEQKKTLPRLELSSEQISRLTLSEKTAYYIYSGDVVYMERAYSKASAYFPEFFVLMNSMWGSIEGIMNHYTNWAKEAFLGVPATNDDRIMGKILLLSVCRFYELMADLLAGLDPLFSTPNFRRGLLDIADNVRVEAVKIVITRRGFALPPFPI